MKALFVWYLKKLVILNVFLVVWRWVVRDHVI
ncbi:Uncharacterised protein [Acinetobacter baumannii]|nr:Uncharacterised protein [Acinetobacter baumannii]